MTEKMLGLLGLMRRAGAVAIGEDQCADAIRAGKGKLLILAEDASEHARRKMESLSSGRNIETAALDASRETLGAALGLGSCAVAVITDLGFAEAFARLLSAQWPERFADMAQRVQSRKEKAQRRKTEKGTKQEARRRTNV
jgi:ribosomal protein L7Ae-like RNA K-turn-binding protein